MQAAQRTKRTDEDDGAGHFTQVVWAGTENLGCAVSTCPEGGPDPGRKIYVCNYDPPGNWRGEFEANVFPAAAADEAQSDDEALGIGPVPTEDILEDFDASMEELVATASSTP